MEILNQLSTEFEAVKNIENRLFEVVQKPLKTGDELFFSPNVFGNYRSTGGNCFGVVGKDYKPQQPKFLLESLSRCIIDAGLDLSKLEYKELRGGAKILFTVPLDPISFVNLRGKDDVTELKLNIMTGFDGLTATSLFLSTYRLICTNGMKASVTEFKSKFKNTTGNTGKIGALCEDVFEAQARSNGLSELLQRLNEVKIDNKRRNEYLTKVLGFNTVEVNELTTRKRNILDKINESVELEISRSGGNLWGLFNGITHYTNHVVKSFENETEQTEYLYTATGGTLNDKALAVAMAFAN